MRQIVRAGRGLGASTGQEVAAASTAVGTTAAAVSAIGTAVATGAAIGSVVPIVGTAIGAIIGAAISFSGTPTVDNLKSVWDVVPFSLIRVTGGSGHWTDPLTGAQLTDAQTDVRKSAVVASALGAFNDTNNFWYDTTTGQHLTPADTWQRWLQKFGNVSFATAYAAAPGAFAIFSPTSSLGDPAIRTPGSVAPVVAPAASAAPGAVAGPSTASLLGGVSPTTLALVAAGLALAVFAGRRRVAA